MSQVKIAEIAEIADDCTVFRNGRNVATYPAGSKTDSEVVELMIGREYSHVFPPKPAPRVHQRAPAVEAEVEGHAITLMASSTVNGTSSSASTRLKCRCTPSSHV